MSMKGNKIDESILQRINDGDVQAVQVEQLKCILSIYPKEHEIKTLVARLSDLGLKSFK